MNCFAPCDVSVAQSLPTNDQPPVVPPVDPGTGGLTVVTTADSATIDFSGNGTAASPLRADYIGPTTDLTTVSNDQIIISGTGQPDSPLEVTLDQNKIIPWGSGALYYVDAYNGDDTNSGRIGAPFASIQHAIDTAPGQATIDIAPGTYNENLRFNKFGQMLTSFATQDAPNCIINGNHVIPINIARIKLKDIGLHGQVGGPTLDLQNTGGKLTFDNVSIDHASGLAGVAIKFTGNQADFIDIKNGSIKGIVDISDTLQTSNITLTIEGGGEDLILHANAARVTTTIMDRPSLPAPLHTQGILFLKDIGFLKKGTDGNTINSSCPAGAGALVIVNTSMLQQADLSLGRINKTGNCPYVFVNVGRNNALDILNGTKIYAETAADLNAGFVPGRYLPADVSVTEHLRALDAGYADGRTIEFEQVTTTLTNVAANDVVNAYIAARPWTLPANLEGSQIYIDTSVATALTLSVQKNGVEIGTIIINGSAFTITGFAVTQFAIGDVFRIVADSAATFNVIGLTIIGLRQLNFVG